MSQWCGHRTGAKLFLDRIERDPMTCSSSRLPDHHRNNCYFTPHRQNILMTGRPMGGGFFLKASILKRNLICGYCQWKAIESLWCLRNRPQTSCTPSFLRMAGGLRTLPMKAVEPRSMFGRLRRVKAPNGRFPVMEAISHFGIRMGRNCFISLLITGLCR